MKEIFVQQPLRIKVALTIILIFVIVGFFAFVVQGFIPPPSDKDTSENNPDMLGEFIPNSIIIPSIDVSASVVPVGVDDEGNMAVPEDLQTVGWYEPGFKPGQFGSAVFTGHVNSRFGLPTIFKDLEKLEIDETFSLLAETGEELVFRVVAINTYDFRNAPLEEIYGPQEVPTVTLITCDDELWLGAEGTYKDRLVVTAELNRFEEEN